MLRKRGLVVQIDGEKLVQRGRWFGSLELIHTLKVVREESNLEGSRIAAQMARLCLTEFDEHMTAGRVGKVFREYTLLLRQGSRLTRDERVVVGHIVCAVADVCYTRQLFALPGYRWEDSLPFFVCFGELGVCPPPAGAAKKCQELVFPKLRCMPPNALVALTDAIDRIPKIQIEAGFLERLVEELIIARDKRLLREAVRMKDVLRSVSRAQKSTAEGLATILRYVEKEKEVVTE